MKSPLIGISTCIDAGVRISPERTYQFLEISYAGAVAEAGGIPFIIPYLKTGAYDVILERIDGLVITGGEDLPTNIPGEVPEVPMVPAPQCRIQQDRALLTCALARRMPMLGICYGMQFINQHFGGTLFYDIPHQLPGKREHKPGNMIDRHPIRISGNSRLRSIIGQDRIEVNSGHHQAVRDVGAGLSLAAACEDGVIEAIEKPGDQFILGLQWHPEKNPDTYSRRIFSALLDACRITSSARL